MGGVNTGRFPPQRGGAKGARSATPVSSLPVCCRQDGTRAAGRGTALRWITARRKTSGSCRRWQR